MFFFKLLYGIFFQAEEARTATDMSRKQDELCLDEIVAMCEEYEEQIAKEIQENKRKNSSASASTLSSITSPSPSLSLHSKTADSTNESCDRSGGGVVGGANYNRQMQVHNWKSGQGKEEETAPQPNANLKSPTSPTGGYNYGRYAISISHLKEMCISFACQRQNA